MISIIGNVLLWLSLLFATLQIIVSSRSNLSSIKLLNNINVSMLLLSILFSFLTLIYGYLISDFSLINVFENSHTSKPIIYKITAVWGNHEGSMLLWILVLCIVNYFIFKFYNQKNIVFISNALQIQSIIIAGFIIFTLFTSNPFDKMSIIPKNGLGFNPILQDPALAIHPPLLYFGYVGLSAVFSISIATLRLDNNHEINWHKYMKPFLILSWSFLTAGIALGSVWAYYELGWGGWWFWDPVENAALMPWILATALLHSLLTVNKKKGLQSWVLILSILCFLLSVIGTFLVRSGILTSVHAFSLDPERGVYILSFIAILGLYSLSLFAIKSKNFFNGYNFYFFSKDGAIFFNNLLMLVICASIFFGTTYPLFLEIFTNSKITVGEPYFNATVIPITIPALIVMGFGPFLSWNKNDYISLKKIFPAIGVVILINIFFFIFFKSININGIIGISLSTWIIINVFVKFYIDFKKNNFLKFYKIINGMLLAHLGIGLLILGITCSSVWKEEKILRMNINDDIIIKDYKIIFKEITKVTGSNYLAIEGIFEVYSNKNKLVKIMKPQNRFYLTTNQSTNEVAIHTNFIRDLYLVLGNKNIEENDEGWIIRIYYNPLVLWIWIGAFFIFLGGIFVFLQNLFKRSTIAV